MNNGKTLLNLMGPLMVFSTPRIFFSFPQCNKHIQMYVGSEFTVLPSTPNLVPCNSAHHQLG